MDNDYEREEVVAKLIAIIDDAVKNLRKNVLMNTTTNIKFR